MKPIYISLNTRRKLMVIPDTDAHLNSHPVLSYSYSIYKDGIEHDQLRLEKKQNPYYLGEIIFKGPDHLVEYQQEGNERLDETEVQQLIKEINHYRDNPNLWSV